MVFRLIRTSNLIKNYFILFLLCAHIKASNSSKKSQRARSSGQIHPWSVKEVAVDQHENSFYKTTSDRLLEARRLFTQSLSNFAQDQTSWDSGLLLLENSIRLYERIICEINLDTVHLYEYGKSGNSSSLIFILSLSRNSGLHLQRSA